LAVAPAHAQGEEQPTVAGEVAAPAGPDLVSYGVAMRTRMVSIPSWFLGLFLKEAVPLRSYGVGGEFFRRKGDMDIVVGFGYQRMSPADGNWLGKGHAASVDTDFVQFRNFGLIGLDVAFIWHQRLNEYFGMHYGAGLGLAFVTGKILRTSAADCTEQNAGDTSMCKPSFCGPEGCSEDALVKSEGDVDNGPMFPHRYKESSVPGAIPIINLVTGLNLRLPEVKGFEARLEVGFYDAFFAGLGMAYVF
jgi:hypothetical protein